MATAWLAGLTKPQRLGEPAAPTILDSAAFDGQARRALDPVTAAAEEP
jgi:hypothetical protein